MFCALTTDTKDRILQACLTFPEFDKQDGKTSFVDKRRADIKSDFTYIRKSPCHVTFDNPDDCRNHACR